MKIRKSNLIVNYQEAPSSNILVMNWSDSDLVVSLPSRRKWDINEQNIKILNFWAIIVFIILGCKMFLVHLTGKLNNSPLGSGET